MFSSDNVWTFRFVLDNQYILQGSGRIDSSIYIIYFLMQDVSRCDKPKLEFI